jgi:signal transduction histidine kinase
MDEHHDISLPSVLPVVDLSDIRMPFDGLSASVPQACVREFKASNACREHYQALRDGPPDRIVQCPFGFSSLKVETSCGNFALTSFVPFPRMGGRKERNAAKQNPGNKISNDGVASAAEQLRIAAARTVAAELELITQQALGLHEIRKLNSKVKQNAERLCIEANSLDPDKADSRLVAIWKASEMMSTQFDIIELLANEKLAQLPVQTEAEIYRIFDKCIRIYNQGDGGYRISIRSPYDFRPRARICDKTFSIIPTVLIENALKYSIPNSEITITWSQPAARKVKVSIENLVNPAVIANDVRIDDSIFGKGRRIGVGKEGSGNGLYLAKLVVDQHKGEIAVRDSIGGAVGFRSISFDVVLPLTS